MKVGSIDSSRESKDEKKTGRRTRDDDVVLLPNDVADDGIDTVRSVRYQHNFLESSVAELGQPSSHVREEREIGSSHEEIGVLFALV